MIQDVPDGSRKRAQPEWGLPGEYPHDGAMSICMDRYLHSERAQTRQAGSRMGTLAMSDSSANRTLFLMKSSKRPLTDELAPRRRDIRERQQELHRARGGRSLMLRYKTRSAMRSRDFLTRNGGCRSCVQERNVSIYVVDGLQRADH